MSMISTQCDGLRERAKELRNLAPNPAVPYLVPSTKETMALAMRSAASEMEDAADTIWELRCKLVENAKLRELMVELWALAYGYAPYESELDATRDMMRELGIEVSE